MAGLEPSWSNWVSPEDDELDISAFDRLDATGPAVRTDNALNQPKPCDDEEEDSNSGPITSSDPEQINSEHQELDILRPDDTEPAVPVHATSSQHKTDSVKDRNPGNMGDVTENELRKKLKPLETPIAPTGDLMEVPYAGGGVSSPPLAAALDNPMAPPDFRFSGPPQNNYGYYSAQDHFPLIYVTSQQPAAAISHSLPSSLVPFYSAVGDTLAHGQINSFPRMNPNYFVGQMNGIIGMASPSPTAYPEGYVGPSTPTDAYSNGLNLQNSLLNTPFTPDHIHTQSSSSAPPTLFGPGKTEAPVASMSSLLRKAKHRYSFLFKFEVIVYAKSESHRNNVGQFVRPTQRQIQEIFGEEITSEMVNDWESQEGQIISKAARKAVPPSFWFDNTSAQALELFFEEHYELNNKNFFILRTRYSWRFKNAVLWKAWFGGDMRGGRLDWRRDTASKISKWLGAHVPLRTLQKLLRNDVSKRDVPEISARICAEAEIMKESHLPPFFEYLSANGITYD